MTLPISCSGLPRPFRKLLVGMLLVACPLAGGHSAGHARGHESASAPGLIEVAEPGHSMRARLQVLARQYALTGNDGVLDEARAVLATAPNVPQPDVWLTAAWLAQAEHRFDSALEFLQAFVAVRPGDPQGWLMTATVAQAAGRHDLTRKACRRLAIELSPLVATACAAMVPRNVAERRVLVARLGKLPLQGEPAELRAWILARTADLAASIDETATAERLYRRALAEQPTLTTIAAYVDVLFAQKRYEDALRVLPQDVTAPAVAVRRLRARAARGENVASETRRMDTRFRAWAAAADYRHGREMAMFYLDVAPDPAFALHVATQNVRIQREPEDLALLSRAEQAVSSATES